ncbi:hypothetical protein ACFLWS_01490 [Chloroflexota bacterium]
MHTTLRTKWSQRAAAILMAFLIVLLSLASPVTAASPSWSAMTSGTTKHLNGVWGSSAADVFAVGEGSTILHSTVPTPESPPKPFPDPELVFVKAEESKSGDRISYYLTITNWSAYPDDLFAPSPDLPPCGTNYNSSRTWVEIYSGEGVRLYGYCALGSAQELSSRLIFSISKDKSAPKSVYVILEDRKYGVSYQSNLVNIPPVTDIISSPPSFSISSLAIQPVEVVVNEIVSISALVDNTGGSEGIYNVILKIDGVQEENKRITLDAGSSKKVTFDVSRGKSGRYAVDVNGLTGSFTVKIPTPRPSPTTTPAPAPATSQPGQVSVYLYGQKVDVVVGEDIVLNLSAINLISKPVMTVQLILKVPSGMSVTSTEFIRGGGGQYTANYRVEPGDIRSVEVHIVSNQTGNFNVTGDIYYYFGNDKSMTKYVPVTLPVTVKHIEDKSSPQFGGGGFFSCSPPAQGASPPSGKELLCGWSSIGLVWIGLAGGYRIRRWRRGNQSR